MSPERISVIVIYNVYVLFLTSIAQINGLMFSGYSVA
jgi:hypothetical protein